VASRTSSTIDATAPPPPTPPPPPRAHGVVVSAGFRFALDRLGFLAPTVEAAIATEEGWPVLDRAFRSSDPDILFVGFAAERRFGPIARFVSGSRFTAHRAREALAP
jgi:FAD-dependent urate hydroxylase